jgi:DNA-binding transcriptional LysR family regulator
MNTKHLLYFLEIAKQKNMNKAAEILFVSQSSLSQYLSRLEQEMGTLLFLRQKGNLTLTPAGLIYHDYAQQILKLEEEMTSKISGTTPSTHIRVGVNSIWSNMLVTSITAQFHLKYPDTTIEMFDENHKILKKLITDGAIDIAVISTDSLDNLPGYRKILRMEEIFFAVSNQNPFMKAHKDIPARLTFPQLIQHFGKEQFILTKSNSSFRPLMNNTFAANDFKPNVICEVSNMTTVRNMVTHNIGVAFIPESIIDPALDITWFSIEPKLTRFNGLICSGTLGFTEEEQHFINLVEDHPLFKS